MSQKHTLEELITTILTMRGQLDTLNENIEKLIEQVRLANSYRFSRHSEKRSVIERQISFIDETETMYDADTKEPDADEVLPPKKKKAKDQRNLDLKDFPVDIIPTQRISEEELNAFTGKATGVRCQMRPTNAFVMNRILDC